MSSKPLSAMVISHESNIHIFLKDIKFDDMRLTRKVTFEVFDNYK